MGLQDRDYIQEGYSNKKRRRSRRADGGAGGMSITLILIFINVALWLANGILFPTSSDRPDFLTESLLLREAYVTDISSCYRFLTYGFAHDPVDMMHIFFNMFGLLMFGYGTMLGVGPGGVQFVRAENVERQLSRREFAAFYLLTILIGGIAFAVINFGKAKAGMLGASGGVCGVIILYAWMFPNKKLLLWGIIPMPMWCLGLLIVFMDAWGAAGGLGDGIAFSVHLVGAAFGTLYYLLFYKNGIELTGWLDSEPSPRELGEWRVHMPDDPAMHPSKKNRQEESFNRRLDEVLKRYGEVGESGLTSEERDFLRRASQKLSEKHQNR